MINRITSSLVAMALAACVLAAPHKISADKAAKIALAKVHGKLVGKPKLENEDGVWQYAVIVQSGKIMKEIGVNADTGKITNVESTTPAEEAKEAKEDAMKAKKMKPGSKAKRKGEGKEKGEAKEKGEGKEKD